MLIFILTCTFVCLFVLEEFIVPLEIFFYEYGNVTVAGEGQQILSSEGSLACHTYCDMGLPFIMVFFVTRDRTPISHMRGERSTSTPPRRVRQFCRKNWKHVVMLLRYSNRRPTTSLRVTFRSAQKSSFITSPKPMVQTTCFARCLLSS